MITELRNMLNVQRLTGTPKLRSYNLAEHSFGVASLFLLLCEKEGVHPNVDSFRHVLFHDIAETITGDLPYPVKNCNSITQEAWEDIEIEVLSKCNKAYLFKYTDVMAEEHMSDKELSLFKSADLLELFFFCIEEVSLGNRTPQMFRVIFKAENLIRELGVTSAIDFIEDTYCKHGNLDLLQEKKFYEKVVS